MYKLIIIFSLFATTAFSDSDYYGYYKLSQKSRLYYELSKENTKFKVTHSNWSYIEFDVTAEKCIFKFDLNTMLHHKQDSVTGHGEISKDKILLYWDKALSKKMMAKFKPEQEKMIFNMIAKWPKFITHLDAFHQVEKENLKQGFEKIAGDFSKNQKSFLLTNSDAICQRIFRYAFEKAETSQVSFETLILREPELTKILGLYQSQYYSIYEELPGISTKLSIDLSSARFTDMLDSLSFYERRFYQTSNGARHKEKLCLDYIENMKQRGIDTSTLEKIISDTVILDYLRIYSSDASIYTNAARKALSKNIIIEDIDIETDIANPINALLSDTNPFMALSEGK